MKSKRTLLFNHAIKSILLLLIFSFSGKNLFAQEQRRVNFIGGARSILTSNELTVNDSIADTTTMKKSNGGYALIDLGVNIKPNSNTEILGMFRIKNDFGGFWGAGVQFDVRQLWVKGVVANALRYQVGDLNLKQTPFTLYNHHADQIDSLPSIFGLQRNIVSYEKFYWNDNSWRMQGANVDFGFSFSKFVKELNFTGFITRLNATDFGAVPDRLMGGGRVELIGNKIFQIGYNANSVFDVLGTIPDSNVFKNFVNTVDVNLKHDFGEQVVSFNTEIGNSTYSYSYDTLAPNYSDYFIHSYASLELKKWHMQATIGYLNVGPDYRSIGAQSKDVNYALQPVYFNRFTNGQQIRPLGLFDVIANDNIYNRTVTSKLMNESSIYNNMLPYGLATNNRNGLYAKLFYKGKKELSVSFEYFNLSEIRGQGTFALKNFDMYKFYLNIPIHKLINSKKTLAIQFSGNLQQTKRKSEESVENIDLQSTQLSAGIRWEFAKNIELLGGIVNQENSGNEYAPVRDSYGQITYYNLNPIDVAQQIVAGGIRYNFSQSIYVCALYQESSFKNKLSSSPDFGMKQFGIIFNMTF
jgi:hypothetical protein